MIDIDIVQQLFPNPLTMAVQLCSTFVLFMLMKKFLWKSVMNLLDRRAEAMQSDLGAAEQARTEAQSDREKAAAQLNEASTKSRDIVDAAVRQARSEKESILAQASREADAERARAHDQIEAERLSMYRDLQKEMVNVAMDAAGKLIGEKSSEEMDREAINAFVKEASGHDQ
jgi:F-type H+-transporting ATPase subunit b